MGASAPSSTMNIKRLSIIPKLVTGGAIYPYSEELLEKGERKTTFGDPYNLFEVVGGEGVRRIWVPRNMAPYGSVKEYSEGFAVNFTSKFKARHEEQTRVVEESVHLLLQDDNFITECPPGFGKCHGRGTPVIMFDGSVRAVQDVVPGDLLMGDDSTPRSVLSVTQGYGDLFLITPNNGDPFVCNDVHVLSLKSTCSEGTKYQRGSVVNIPLNEYLQESGTFKHRMKLWKVGVSFPHSPKLHMDPYFLGAMLGDGSMGAKIGLTTMDPELVSMVYAMAGKYCVNVRVESQEGNASKTYYFVQEGTTEHGNLLRNSLRRLGLLGVSCGDKFIPPHYLRGSIEERLHLLAGLIDTDGHHTKNCYEVTFKSKRLHDDLVFLARSLGFGVSRAEKSVNGVSYYRAFISGDTDRIPVRIPRKKAAPRTQKKDVLLSGFSVTYLGKGDYYGFTLDGNSLYLLGDFTVTHNTACAMEVIAQVGRKTIVIVTKEDIRDQWADAFKKFLGLADADIGYIQADKFQITGKKVVIAMVHSLAKEGRYPAHQFREFGLAIWDECFPRGTMVGARPIESYSCGDTVESVQADGSIGPSSVRRVKTKLGDWFARTSCGGYTLFSTANQPIFVEGLGYVPAALLKENDYVLRQVQRTSDESNQENKGEIQEGAPNILLHRARGVIQTGEIEGKVGEISGGVQSETCFRENAKGEPDEEGGGSGEGFDSSQGEAVSSKAWRERGHDARSATDIVELFGEFITCSGIHDWSPKRIRKWLANEVRIGYCDSEQEALHRIRWAFAQHFENSGSRLSEGGLLEGHRVESSEVQERGSAIELGWGIGDGTVFNLEVEETHNYFAGGFLAHNCHRVGAEQFAKSCYRLPAKLRWGLSATPDRKDGRLETIHAHLGPVLVKSNAAPMTPKVIVRKSPWKIPQTKITDPKTGQATIGPIPHTAGKCGHVINILSRNHHRNVMLADFAFQAYKKGRNVLVQSDRVEHLEMLALLIQKCGVPPGEFAFYVGGLTKEQREYAKTKRIIMACVSEDTECLTFEGWKDYSQLVTGELVATYNLQRKVIEYQPLLGVHTYDFSGKLCHVSRKSADILMTWNHRNVVEGRDGVQRVVRADELQRTHKIRTFSPMEYPEEVSIGVDLAALVGWVISEGSYHDGKRGKSGVKIYQNRGEKANAIRSLLNSLGMSFTERAYDSDLHQIMFRLSGKSGKVIRDLTPDKRLNKLLVSLPLTESQALFDSLIDGDGHRRKDNGNLMFIQKDKVTVDWFCILAMRLGYKPTVSSAEDSNGNHTYRVYLGHADLVSLSNGKHKVESKDYSGVVWCPSTPNTTWVARRNGTVFITGNTYQMTAEATDIPKMDTLVMGTPKSDIRQIIGRITRWVEGKNQPLIFDLVDDSSSVFKGYAKTRMELYVTLGAEINRTTVVKKSA